MLHTVWQEEEGGEDVYYWLKRKRRRRMMTDRSEVRKRRRKFCTALFDWTARTHWTPADSLYYPSCLTFLYWTCFFIVCFINELKTKPNQNTIRLEHLTCDRSWPWPTPVVWLHLQHFILLEHENLKTSNVSLRSCSKHLKTWFSAKVKESFPPGFQVDL